MSNIPEKLKYDSSQHLWVENIGEKDAVIGLTDHGQAKWGAVQFIELGEEGTTLAQGEAFTTIETEKKSVALKMPFEANVISYNQILDDEPEAVNEAPYENWIVKVRITNVEGFKKLCNAAAYAAFIAE